MPVSAAIGPVTDLKISEANLSPDGQSRIMQVAEGTNNMDGIPFVTQCPIIPDKAFQYDFVALNQSGTYFYHSESSEQSNGGIVGPLVIYDPNDPHSALYDSDDESNIVMLSDYYRGNPIFLLSSRSGATSPPDNGLINGSLRSIFNLAPGKRHRLRVINSGAIAAFQFSIDNHMLTVIEADGVAIQPVTVQRLPINVGQRYSVIVHTDQTVDNYWMRAVMNTNDFPTKNNALDPVIKAIVRYSNAPESDPLSSDWGSEPWSGGRVDLALSFLKPLLVQDAPPADQQVILNIAYNFQTTTGTMNGVSWDPPTAPALLQVLSGTQNFQDVLPKGSTYPVNGQTVEIVLNNNTPDSHVFHLNGHTFFIVGSGKGAYLPVDSPIHTVNPPRRDTITIESNCYTVLRFIGDNPGIWAFYSQIEWFKKIGLMIQFMYPANSACIHIHWQRNLSILGKGVIVNSLALAKLWHTIWIFQPDKGWVSRMREKVTTFMCINKPNPAWNTICTPQSLGGLGVIDLMAQGTAFHLSSFAWGLTLPLE
ncbi:hypothetical protein BGZ83_011148 [Gryganskiella cystojenkinii]|nr:hypothetical protein BGZ83_011148 [Gryganskiella cystojenkinii]